MTSWCLVTLVWNTATRYSLELQSLSRTNYNEYSMRQRGLLAALGSTIVAWRHSSTPSYTGLMFQIEWYKLGLLMHRCLQGTAPKYLVDCCTPSPTSSLQLVVPRHRLTTLGRRAFAVMGPTVWNSLSDDLRAQQNIKCFCRHLKTFLFSHALLAYSAHWRRVMTMRYINLYYITYWPTQQYKMTALAHKTQLYKRYNSKVISAK